MWGIASESPLNNRSYHLQKMSSRKPAQSPYTNHWGREGRGLEPDPSGYNSLVTRNSPHRLTRNTSITLAIFSAMFEVPVNTYLLMGLLLYSISTHFTHLQRYFVALGCLSLYHVLVHDKGKPVARRGRKAYGPLPIGRGGRATERSDSYRLPTPIVASSNSMQ